MGLVDGFLEKRQKEKMKYDQSNRCDAEEDEKSTVVLIL